MESRSLFIIISILTIVFITSTSWTYKIVTGETKCQGCHLEYDNGTLWHKSHSIKTSCTNCHESGVGTGDIPIESCTVCHTPSAFIAAISPEDHEEATSAATCLGACHTANIDPPDDDDECPLESALGTENARIDILKQFRNEILASNLSGRMLIKLYYTAAPVLSRAVNSSLVFKQMTVRLIDAIIPAIETTLKKE